MNFHLHWKQISPSEPLRAHVERRLGFSLGRFSLRVQHVRVLLADDNGERGGVDKSCALQLRAGSEWLQVIERDHDLYVAIDLACDRMQRILARVLDRRPFQNSGRWRAEGLLRRRHQARPA